MKNKLYKLYLFLRPLNRTDPLSEACLLALSRYKSYRNSLTSLLRRSKRQYLNDKFLSSQSNSRETWKLINDLLHRKNSNSSNFSTLTDCHGIAVSTDNDIVNLFNSYFSNIGGEINNQISTMMPTLSMVTSQTPFSLPLQMLTKLPQFSKIAKGITQ